MRYKTMKDLAEGFRRGELKGYVLWLDNDCFGLRYDGPVPEGQDSFDYPDERTDEAQGWYRGKGYAQFDLVLELLEVVGVPTEMV